MSFTDAVSSVYRNYAKFDGRATRPEYWWFVLFTILVAVGMYAFGLLLYAATRSTAVFGLIAIALLIFLVVSIIPSIAVGVRRLHDSDKSGWWYLIGFIPYLGGIILLILFVLPSTPGYNRFGPPAGRSSAAQRVQYWGPGRPEALRKFAEDAQRAAASGYHPVWQDWKMGPTGEVLEVVYDQAPAAYGWGQQGGYPPGGGGYPPGGGGYPPGGGGYPPGAPYQTGPTAYPPGGTWYQVGPGGQYPAPGTAPQPGSTPDQPGQGSSSDQAPGGPPQPPSWS